jgi:hypothetical protein
MELFDVVPEEELARWATRFRRERYRRGTIVVRQADPPTAFYIVDQGELRALVEAEDEGVPRAYFYPGDFFGETGLLTGQLRNATIDVLTDVVVFVLDRLEFDQLLDEYPTIRERLLAVSWQREQMGRTRFSWQHPDEVTIFFSTKHWAALLTIQRTPIFLGILGLLATAGYLWLGLSNTVAAVLMVSAGTLWALSVFMLVYNFFDWRNDHYIITNRRVLHVERVLLTQEERDEAPLERVQDVQVFQNSILANLLGFGDVVIQTAAATQKVVFAAVPNPEYVREALFAPLQHARTREKAEVRESIRQELGHRLNIAVPYLGGQPGTATDGSGDAEREGEGSEQFQEAFGLADWLGRFWRSLRGVFAFETRVVSDGGNTITWRKNGWVLVRVSFLPVLMSGLIFLFLVFAVQGGIATPVLPLLLVVLLAFGLGWWFYVYWDWQNDIYQVTGNRLIDLKKRPLFLAESRRETTLDRIENIGLSIPGVLAQILNYGTVIIETAGETGAFKFQYVHDPRSVQAEIFSLRERYTQRQQQADIDRRHAEFAEWFEIYEELKQTRDSDMVGGVSGDGAETDTFIR